MLSPTIGETSSRLPFDEPLAAACRELLRQQHTEVQCMLKRQYEDLLANFCQSDSVRSRCGPRASAITPPPECAEFESQHARQDQAMHEKLHHQLQVSASSEDEGSERLGPFDKEKVHQDGHPARNAANESEPNESEPADSQQSASPRVSLTLSQSATAVIKAGSRVSRFMSDTQTSTANRSSIQHVIEKKHKQSWASQSTFDGFIGVIILMNAAVMVLDLQWQGTVTAVLLGRQEQHDWEFAKDVIVYLEYIFTCIFVLEMFYRIYLHGWKCCCSLWHIFDGTIVIISCIDILVLTPLTNSSSMVNVTLLRLMRMTRLVRAFRIVRTLRLFKGLRVLTSACTSFLPSLCWSMVLLTLLMTMGGLMIGNLLQEFIADSDQAYEDRLWVWLHYGTAYRAVYTMYEITFAGNWPIYARPVLETVDQSFCVFFFLYVTFVVFAVTRVIAAIILRDTMEAAGSDAEVVIQEREAKKAAYVKKLEGVFLAADTSGDGMVSVDEMHDILKDDAVRTYLQALDLEVHETTALFRLLDDGDGFLTYDEFINGILRFKGGARAIDLMAMSVELKQLMLQVDKLHNKICRDAPDEVSRRSNFREVQQRNNFQNVDANLSAFRKMMIHHSFERQTTELSSAAEFDRLTSHAEFEEVISPRLSGRPSFRSEAL